MSNVTCNLTAVQKHKHAPLPELEAAFAAVLQYDMWSRAVQMMCHACFAAGQQTTFSKTWVLSAACIGNDNSAAGIPGENAWHGTTMLLAHDLYTVTSKSSLCIHWHCEVGVEKTTQHQRSL